MAKKSGEPNKSQAIRTLLTQQPKLSTPEVIETLSKQGVPVKAGLVYLIKGKMRARRRRKARENAVKVAVSSGNHDALATIRKVKGLASEVGGMSKLKALVEALAE